MHSQKGFTLFTALISLLLVSIALALIFNMITTEENYLELINDQSSMSDLMTVADLVRADAFNSFIIYLRSSWEDAKSRETAEFRLTRVDLDKNWEDYTQDFIKSAFFEREFPSYFAQAMLHHVRYSENPPGYTVTIKEKTGQELVCSPEDCTPGDSGCNCSRQLINQDDNDLFVSVISDLFKTEGEKADIIDCNQTDVNCNGSFFLTLDTTKLSDENYEILPIVTVLKTKTNQVIQRPVLSRQVYKIYIPWRGLQAIRVARNLVLSNEAEKNANPATTNSAGFFSPKIHNTLEQARLGFCDAKTCMPRTSFFESPAESGTTSNNCESFPAQPLSGDVPAMLEPISLNLGQYDVYNHASVDENINSKFLTLHNTVLSQNILERLDSSQKIIYDDNLVMDGEIVISDPDIKISKINLTIKDKRTKQMFPDTSTTEGSSTYSSAKFERIDQMPLAVGGLGLFLEDGKSKLIFGLKANDSDINDWITTNETLAPPGADTPDQNPLACYEISGTDIKLKFIEENPKYKIKDSYRNIETQINVIISDNYTPFYFPTDNESWPELSVNAYGYLIYPLNQNLAYPDLAVGDNWKCATAPSDPVNYSGSCLPTED